MDYNKELRRLIIIEQAKDANALFLRTISSFKELNPGNKKAIADLSCESVNICLAQATVFFNEEDK